MVEVVKEEKLLEDAGRRLCFGERFRGLVGDGNGELDGEPPVDSAGVYNVENGR